MALAMEWVAKITTISLEMVLPGIGGSYLDELWGTKYLAITGFGLGMAVGLWHLILLTNQNSRRKPPPDDSQGTET